MQAEQVNSESDGSGDALAERYIAWTYLPCINFSLRYKLPYPSYKFDDAKLLEPGNPVPYTDHTHFTMYYIWL